MFLSDLLINNITFPSSQLLVADLSVGFFLINQPVLFFPVLFFGVWIIEALVLRKKLGGSPEKILFASFVVNLITTLLGALVLISGAVIFFFDIFYLLLPELYGSIIASVALIVTLFFLSAIIETPLLLFFYREKSWKEVFKTSIWMNVKSYLFVVVFLILDSSMLSFLLVVVLIPWCLIEFFNILSKNEKLSKNKKILLVALLASIIIAVVIFEVTTWPDSRRSYVRDAKRRSDLRQIHLAMEMYYDEHQKYPQSEVMPAAIDDYLNPVPQDPTGGPYHWISNTSDSQKYCVWVHLDRGNYFIASHEGIRQLDHSPDNLDCY